MATGLSRISPDVTDTLERFAIISHNAGLPDFEKAFRTLSTLYQSYLSRKASFQTMELIREITKLYFKVTIYLETEDLSLLTKQASQWSTLTPQAMKAKQSIFWKQAQGNGIPTR